MIHRKLYIACLAISTLFSCSDVSKPKENNLDLPIAQESEPLEITYEPSNLFDYRTGDYSLEFPLDTAELIANMQLIDRISRTDLIDTDPEKLLLSEKIDTFEMYSVSYGCICANWSVLNCDNSSQDEYSGPCQYYIEPADEALELTIPYDNVNTTIRFIGKKYLRDAEDRDYGEGSHGGQRFKYYSFEFIRPYMVYGPRYNDTIFSENGMDTILETMHTYLTIE